MTEFFSKKELHLVIIWENGRYKEREIVNFRPDSSSKTANMQLATGTLQSLPTEGLRLIKVTRNKNLYINLKNDDTFSDRLIILLFHFGFFLKVYKKDMTKSEAQNLFDYIIRQIELSIREIGYVDVAVNK